MSKTIEAVISALGLALIVASGAACRPEATAGASGEPPERPSNDNVTAEGDGIRLSEASRAHVAIEPAGVGLDTIDIRTPARVSFRDSAISRVGAPIGARVMKLHVQVGDKVRVNDPLATLASPDASGFHAELARARVEQAAAEDALARQTEMLEKGVGREYEKVVAEMRVKDATERVRAAKRDVSLLGKSFGGTVIVTSQIEGTVLRRNASVGAQVDPEGEPLFEIGNPTDLWLVADVFQSDLDLIHEGAPVTIDIASQTASIDGVVESVGVMLDTTVRRAPVYVSVKPEARKSLRPGMFARATFHAQASDRMTLPTAAVLFKNGDKSIVYVERPDGTFAARDVGLGHNFGERVEIVSGLAVGDKVVVKGGLLIDGAANLLL
ncbi:MAG: efflux RND transporter periplasmic adaptor subunit [Nannocystaceae bacterium]|nr:efflux RND transporter periplasmic adaptor subunit [Nannocystaceae bacterium]